MIGPLDEKPQDKETPDEIPLGEESSEEEPSGEEGDEELTPEELAARERLAKEKPFEGAEEEKPVKKKWHFPKGIGLIALIMLLVIGGVVAASSLLLRHGTAPIVVQEAIDVEYQYPSQSWSKFSNGTVLSIASVFPGDSVTIPFKITNYSTTSWTVRLDTINPSSITVTGSWLGAGLLVQGSQIVTSNIVITVEKSATAGIATVELDWYRV